MHSFQFPTPPHSAAAEALRGEVRDFLADTLRDRPALARADSWNGYDAAFSQAMGAKGWIAMTWPKAYGGHERSAFERYVVIEEMLAAGAPVFADVRMVCEGVIRARLPACNDLVCTLNEPPVPGLARRLGTTRSAAAVDLWRDRLEGSVVVVGNAPTALFHLLERIGEGFPRPAAILGFPVGFVGAAESKEALLESPLDIPCLALRGRRGGSAIAAAAINALAAGVPEEGDA